MRGLAFIASRLTTWAVLYKKILPAGFAFLVLAIGFATRLFRDGLASAFEYLALSLLAAELTIKQQIDALIAGSTSTFVAGIEIAGALIILIGVIKILSSVLINVTGSQAKWGAYLIAIVVVGIVEYTAIYAFTDVTGFVPLRDGLLYLLVNLELFIPSWLGTGSLPTGGLDSGSVNTNSTANLTNTTG